jgi:predicted transcriptional regulator
LPNERYAYILLSDKKWWNRLCERNRNNNQIHMFVRRNSVGPLKTQKLLFYVKKPIMQIRGVADFIERLTGDYKDLWNMYGDESYLETFDEYVSFLKGRKTVTFIRFTNFRELDGPVSMKVIRKVLGVLTIPRGGKYLNRETANQLTV